MWRSVLEYKTNFWSAIIIQLFFLGTYVLFLDVFSRNFGDIIGWSTIDFVFFLILVDTVWVLSGIFFWRKSLFFGIKNGLLNNYLLRPINPFVGFNLSSLDFGGMVMFLMNLIFIVYYILSQNIKLLNLSMGVFLIIVVVLCMLLFIWFIESLNFFYKGLSQGIEPIIGSLADISNKYPYQYFKFFGYKLWLLFFPAFFVSSLIMPAIKGDFVFNWEVQLLVLLGFIFFYSLFTYLGWKFGLKRYEAFG
jgi:ABC-type uncharacterized transport system permease subunit